MSAADAGSYRGVVRAPGVARVLLAAALGRTAANMLQVVLVLFVVTDLGSPQLAGAAVLFAVAPGLLFSPVAGALLDRCDRVRLTRLDYVVAALCPALIAELRLWGHLSPGLLLAVVGVASLTTPLSGSGTRTLLPLLVRPELWDRANALDSAGFTVAGVLGPALAGVAVGTLGATRALFVVAIVNLCAASSLISVRDTTVAGARRGHLLAATVEAVSSVVGDPVLRGLAVASSIVNVGLGALVVSLPLLVIARGGNAAAVGVIWALEGLSATSAGFVLARLDTRRRERMILTVTEAMMACGIAVVALAPALPVIAAGAAIVGLGDGPRYVCLASLRQRRTDPSLLGRVISVSVTLNVIGLPVGAAVGGAVAARSATASSWLAAAVAGLAAAITIPLIPRGGRR